MESEILKKSVTQIDKLLGINCKVLSLKVHKNNNTLDAEIALAHNNNEVKYFVEIKRRIVPEQIPGIIEQAEEISPLMLVADYISPKAKELLRLKNISYADTAGNMYLSDEGIYIYIQTNKTNREKLKTYTRAFSNAGLKVLFQFLKNPAYLNKSYRFIGDKAKVTISTVGTVIHNLLKENFIVQIDDKKYQFVDRKRLFEEWVKEYNNSLRLKLKQKRYKWLTKDTHWKNIELPRETYWGGVNAAELLTEYIIADRMQIYTSLPFQDVMKTLKIIPDDHGEIIVIETFWKNEEASNNLIDPILIYADLLFDANPRSIEIANKIYKEYVQDKL